MTHTTSTPATTPARFDDRDLYGRSTTEQRTEWHNALAAASEAKRALCERDGASAYGYAMGWYDALYATLTREQREALLRVAWNVADEVRYVAFLFHTHQTGMRQGPHLAVQSALKATPSLAYLVDRNAPAPTSN